MSEEENLAEGGFFITPSEVQDLFYVDSQGSDVPWDVLIAAKNAVILAEHDLNNDVFCYLVYGGPMAPWATPDSIMMRKLGISVYATALCEVDPYTRVFTSVYNAVTAEKLMPWATHPSFTKGFVVNVCSGHLIAPNFDDCLKIKNEHS